MHEERKGGKTEAGRASMQAASTGPIICEPRSERVKGSNASIHVTLKNWNGILAVSITV